MYLLERLTQTDSVSGHEAAIAEIIKNEVRDYVDEILQDALGNLIVHIKGSGKKLLFAAHMDEIGIVVTFIDEAGFLRFSNVGGLYKKDLLGRKVRFANGVIGVIGAEEENKDRDIAKMYIDIGAADREDAEAVVSVGDTAAFTGGFYRENGVVIAKALDNRAGCYVLIEAIKRVKSENDLYFVFTVQEEVGLRGAKTAAFDVVPDFAVAVDVTDTGDTPNASKMAVRLGKGAAVKIMDRSVMCSVSVRNDLIALAKQNNIPYQLEVMTDGGTDAGALSLTGAGIKTGGVSIPCRYVHSPAEMAAQSDIAAAVDLIVEYAGI